MLPCHRPRRRAIEYAAASRCIMIVSGILDRPVKPGDDSGECCSVSTGIDKLLYGCGIARTTHLSRKLPVGLFCRSCATLSCRANHHDALAHPASSARGVRAIVTTRETGCDGRGGASRRVTPTRTVKSCGPGAPVLASSLSAFTRRAGDGGKKAGPQGDHEAAVKPSRREGREVSAEPVVTAACIFSRTRATGAANSRPSLRPPFAEGHRASKTRTPERRGTCDCMSAGRRGELRDCSSRRRQLRPAANAM